MANWLPLNAQTVDDAKAAIQDLATTWDHIEFWKMHALAFQKSRRAQAEEWKAIGKAASYLLTTRCTINAVVAGTATDNKSVTIAVKFMRHEDVINCDPEVFQRIVSEGYPISVNVLLSMMKRLRQHTVSILEIALRTVEFSVVEKSDILFEACRHYTGAHYAIVKCLLYNGATPNYWRLQTPTITKLAARKDSYEAFKFMLLYGLNSLQESYYNVKASNLRRDMGYPDYETWNIPTVALVAILFKGPNAVRIQGKTLSQIECIQMAIRNGAKMPTLSVFDANGKLVSVPGLECGHWIQDLRDLPKVQELLWFSMPQNRSVWKRSLHWTFSRESRIRIETLQLCIKRFAQESKLWTNHHIFLPTELVDMILERVYIE